MNSLTRRAFLKLGNRLLTVTGVAAILGPIVAFFYPSDTEEMPSEPVSAGSLDNLDMNESITVRFGRYPAIIIHTPDGLRAYSAVCTHFACVVKWDAERGEIVCPCHDGFFDPEDGTVISGPPPSELDALQVEIVDGQIFVGAKA